MTIDHAIYTGDHNNICYDYACSGFNAEGLPFAIVSDGCSLSPDIDTGFRILTKALEKQLKHCDSEISAISFQQNIESLISPIIKDSWDVVKKKLNLSYLRKLNVRNGNRR